MNTLLSSAYLPPIEYCAFLLQDEVWLEQCENFQKQSFRTRSVILTSNGPLTLSVPVVHSSVKEPISQTRIEYVTPWQRTHWRAIESAYGGSPYFLYYQDALRPFYEQHFDYLFDFNLQLLQTILRLLKIRTSIHLTEDFAEIQPNDLRTTIHPRKKSEPDYPLAYRKPYYQVFSEKFGFTPNLSIIDLLFNIGPESTNYLKDAYQYFQQTLTR